MSISGYGRFNLFSPTYVAEGVLDNKKGTD